MSIRIAYNDRPPGAKEACTPSSTDRQPFSRDPEIIEGAPQDGYATLEPHGWPLDGSRLLIPATPEQIGWWSGSRSQSDGVFSTPPKIELVFSAPFTATGLTFSFSPATGEFCTRIRVAWYLGAVLLRSAEYHPNSPDWVLTQTVTSFDRVHIELLGTNYAEHFAKVRQIIIGKSVVFGPGEIVSARYSTSVDPSLSALTVDTLSIRVRDDREVYAPQANQLMELYDDGGLVAAHYIKSAARESSDLYRFDCQSAIGQLEGDFLGGMYTSQPLHSVLNEILTEYEFTIPPEFSTVTVSGYLPVSSRREALQQVCFATGLVPSTQGSNTIEFAPISTDSVKIIPNERVFFGTTVTTEANVYSVTVYAHQYSPGDTADTIIREETVDGENILYTFAEPHHSYSITGGALTGTGVNWVTITAHGTVSVTAKPYVHTTEVVTRVNPEATAAERANIVTVDEATLVTTANASLVADRLYQYYRNQHIVDTSIVATDERPGQIATIADPWGGHVRGYITAMDYTFTPRSRTAVSQIRGATVMGQSAATYSGQDESQTEGRIYDLIDN